MSLTLDDLKKVFHELSSIESKVYLLLLTECDLRPGESFLVRLRNVDFENRIIWFESENETRRRYLTLMYVETAKFIKEKYLLIREIFIKQVEPGIKASSFFSDEVIEEWK